jgi:hypothetical protein
MALNELGFVEKFQASGEQLHLVVINALIHLLAIWMTIEALIVFFRPKEPEEAAQAAAEAAPAGS